MKERPILFNGKMVRAILEGRKTQTRRLVTTPMILIGEENLNHDDITCRYLDAENGSGFCAWLTEYPEEGVVPLKCPYGQPGDRLWVKETFAYTQAGLGIIYRASMVGDAWRAFERRAITWKPCIHMPRSASRIVLEITAVRVERLQEISEEDARAEGFEHTLEPIVKFGCGSVIVSARDQFAKLWDSIYGKRPGQSWTDNPWIWAVQFKMIQPQGADHA